MAPWLLIFPSAHAPNHLARFSINVYAVYVNATPTIQKIAIAALQLLEQEGVEAVTMRRVASAVGVTAMALYRHYPDRAGLLNALSDAGFADLTARLKAARLTGDIEAKLIKILDVTLNHALENPRLFELMFLERREGARQFPRDFKAGRSPTANITMDLIQEGMDTGVFRKDDAVEIVFEMGALLQGLIMLYLGGRTDMSPTLFRRYCHRSFRRYMYGIRK
jgi:AcrR family transcriptional regulator